MSFSFGNRRLIVGVGSALVDLLAHVDEAVVDSFDGARGGMTLVDDPFIDRALSTLTSIPARVPGGSACNTLVGIGCLGGEARFIGKRGDDEAGRFLESDLKQSNVTPRLYLSENPTGRVLSLVTPDAQRTMFTSLGASSEIEPEEITPDALGVAAIVHLEGYLLFKQELAIAAMKVAKDIGAKVSLDLASYTIVESTGDLLKELVDEYIDILLANEDEARAYCESQSEEDMLGELSAHVDLAVLKLGERGSIIKSGSEVLEIDITSGGPAIDTTGAGDLYAAGLLQGLVSGLSLKGAGKLGAMCGGEVCLVDGAYISEDRWQTIRQYQQSLF